LDELDDPWLSVCQPAQLVFRHYELGRPAQLLYQVVNVNAGAAGKELVAVFRHDWLINEYLRRSLPGLAPLDEIRSTAVAATNNANVLDAHPSAADLRAAPDDVHRSTGCSQTPTPARRRTGNSK
jgi:hypothetical protein